MLYISLVADVKELLKRTYILTFCGILVIIGTAGASNNYNIPFTQIIIQLLQGFLCCGVAWVLNFIKLVIE